MKFTLTASLLLSIFFFSQCGNKAPIEWTSKGPDSNLVIPTSYYELPVVYPVANLEDWLNEKIQGNFFSKKLAVNEDGDSLNLDITKLSDIKIRIRNKKVHVAVPVAVEGIYQKNLIGIKLKNKHPVKAELVINLVSTLDIDENWHLVIKSQLSSLKWTKSPTLKMMGMKFDLQSRIHDMLMERSSELTQKFDEAIHKKVNLQKPIGKVWHDIQKPIFLHKYHPQAWMKILGQKVSARVDLSNDDALVFHILVEGENYAVLDSLTLPPSTKLPKLKKLKQEADSFFIVIHGKIPFDMANEILNEKLNNQKIEKGGYSITIARIEIKGSDSGLVVRVKVKGDIRGYLYVLGTPVFDPVEQKLRVENFKFLVETSDNLVNAADAMMHDALIAYLNEYLEFDLIGPISTVPNLIHQGIEKGKSGKQIDLVISQIAISNWRLLLNDDNLQFQIDTRGKATLEIEKLRVKKQVNIQ